MRVDGWLGVLQGRGILGITYRLIYNVTSRMPRPYGLGVIDKMPRPYGIRNGLHGMFRPYEIG